MLPKNKLAFKIISKLSRGKIRLLVLNFWLGQQPMQDSRIPWGEFVNNNEITNVKKFFQIGGIDNGRF
jgi:hypothetical protein